MGSMNAEAPVSPRRALLSVADKTGIVEFARALADRGIELISTGGTRVALAAAAIPSIELATYTGFPEIMDGRVKTLHPKVHGGILARREADAEALRAHRIPPIDLVVVNLYPFERAIAADDVCAEGALAHIDIGGPTLLRGAAKNHGHVLAVAHPGDYGRVIEALEAGGTTAAQRLEFAAKAFAHTARYDAAIAGWFSASAGSGASAPVAEDPGGEGANPLPQRLALHYGKRADMRYGENPHQRAAFYVEAEPPPGTVGNFSQLQGRALSYNNIADVDAALQCVGAFDAPACVIAKHASPCGVAVGADLAEAYAKAFAADPTSAFGGVVAFNRALDAITLQALLDKQFAEVVAAPAVAPPARAAARAKKALRLLEVGAFSANHSTLAFKRVAGGLLAQEADAPRLDESALHTATARAATAAERADLMFAWRVCAFVKSNAIVLAREGGTVGIGGGQPSRVASVQLAARRAKEEGHATSGAVLASDAFFPFRDGLDAAAAAGVTAIIQPGGSKRDAECIAAADEHGMAMLFTDIRHFRH